MDQESPFLSRVERTLWTVWTFITEAVNRLLKPEQANNASNDPNPLQDSAVDGEPEKEDEANVTEADGDQPLLSSSWSPVSWDLCTTEINHGPEERSVRLKTEKESEIAEDSKEEELAQIEKDDSGLFAKDGKAEDDQNMPICRQEEILANEDYDEKINIRPQILTGDATGEDLTCAEAATEREVMPDFCPKTEKILDDKATDYEHDFQADNDEIKSCKITGLSQPLEDVSMQIEEACMQKNETEYGASIMASENENKTDKVEKQPLDNEKGSCDVPVFAYNKSTTVSEGEVTDAEGEHAMAPENESDKSEDVKEKKDESTLEVREQEAVIEEEVEKTSEALIEVTGQEGNSLIVLEGSQEEDYSNEEKIKFVPDVKTIQHSNEEQEKLDASLKGRLTETDDGDSESYDTDMSKNVRVKSLDSLSDATLSNEDEAKESYVETVPPVTVKPKSETGQEISVESEDISKRALEGRSVVSPELNPPTCEEAREGVPEHNNEPGLDENTTQRFLEVEDTEEVQTTQLPEEAEGKGLKSLQNSGSSTVAECLLVWEHMEEVQGDSESLRERELNESGLVFAEEDIKLMVASMKTGTELSALELECDFGSSNEKDLQNEVLLVEIDNDSRPTENMAREETLKFFEAEEQSTTQESLLDLEDTANSEQESNRTPSLQVNTKEIVQTKSEVLEDEDCQDVEDIGCQIEEVAAGDEVANNEVGDLDPTEITTENNASELTSSRDVKFLKTKDQLSQETHDFETTKSEPKGVTIISVEELPKPITELGESHAEDTVCSVIGNQDVIEEEILDLWIEALSEDDKHQKEPELGMQSHPDRKLSKEDQNERVEEPLVESNSGESELVSDTEMSLSTAESGFSDHSLSESSVHSNETQLLKSTSVGEVQGMHGMSVGVSELVDISELSSLQQSCGSQDALIEATPEGEPSNLKDEEQVMGFHLKEEDLRQAEHLHEETHEGTHEDDGSQTDDNVTDLLSETVCGNSEEDLESLTEASPFFQINAETLDINVCNSNEEIQQTESTDPRRVSEASSWEEIQSADFGPQDDTSTQPEEALLMPPLIEEAEQRWSEDSPDSSTELNTAGEDEPLKTDIVEQFEVAASVLDFTAQRSRIAVKNPQVRPPKFPRSLINMPSVDPTPVSRSPAKIPTGVPLGGMGIGIKLPGLGAGFPALRKTKQVIRDDDGPESDPQKSEMKAGEKSDSSNQDETQHKPKWMPPRQPGFGNPMMSELKSKLKKPTQD